MIFHSKEHNTIYYSHGKVGSSSLAMALNAMKSDHDWIDSSSKHYTVAEIKEDEGMDWFFTSGNDNK